jgi:hypothetical protein
MNLHQSIGKTAKPPQNSFSNHHAVSRASIGAESVSLQVVASIVAASNLGKNDPGNEHSDARIERFPTFQLASLKEVG